MFYYFSTLYVLFMYKYSFQAVTIKIERNFRSKKLEFCIRTVQILLLK